MSLLSWRKTSSNFASGWDTLIPWVCSAILWWNWSSCFWSTDEMQCTTCRAIKATVLCEEAIAVRASAPSETHMRAYMTGNGWQTFQNPSSTLRGGGEPHSPAQNTHPGGETLHHLQGRSWWPSWPRTVSAYGWISARRSHSMSWTPPRSPPPKP